MRVYYEARLAKVELPDEARGALDAEFDEVAEAMETESRERLKTRWARIEAIVGAEKRIAAVAADIVEHWEKRRAALTGKGLIVWASPHLLDSLNLGHGRLLPGPGELVLDWRSVPEARVQPDGVVAMDPGCDG
ncbi:hypothetical protein [Acidimicrobium ferrooxidans]|uniref:hypothetical protein n=1 Tax=Acidimicrobium ferrooxidans TaxID=53635 RepID=UPI00269AD3C4